MVYPEHSETYRHLGLAVQGGNGMTTEEWIAAFAAAAGVEAPSAQDIDTLLQLAAVAAHASERTAAPITCWIAAAAGLAPTDALSLAESLRPTAP